MKNNHLFYVFAVLLLLTSLTTKGQSGNIAILPKPYSLEITKGAFTITDKTIIIADNDLARQAVGIFNQYIAKYHEFRFTVIETYKDVKNPIIIKEIIDEAIPEDAYRMNITPENILIEGKGAGVFYALQTLRQLLPAKRGNPFEIPCLKIYDYPQYKWRGMQLDVSRHFFQVDEIKRYIDLLAFYKMNVFQWHLTDDQGWRIVIDKYPKLTSIGGYRNGTQLGSIDNEPKQHDSIKYGGFYTKELIREVINYASERQVMIVPVIELPGHCMAALAAYPEFSCTGKKLETAKSWGEFDDVYCSKDETIDFLKDILSEIVELFPSRYIHIGGEGCSTVRWESCPNCQAIMNRENLKDEKELHGYIVRSIEKYVNSVGKTIIGWDEILDGNLQPDALVMSAIGNESAITASKQKHNVIMSPKDYCNFDNYQIDPKLEPLAKGGITSVEKVYSFNPMPQGLTPEQKKSILGGQGFVWTEYIGDFKMVEYMAVLRMIALSEVLWLPDNKKNLKDFSLRLNNHKVILDLMEINYPKPKE